MRRLLPLTFLFSLVLAIGIAPASAHHNPGLEAEGWYHTPNLIYNEKYGETAVWHRWPDPANYSINIDGRYYRGGLGNGGASRWSVKFIADYWLDFFCGDVNNPACWVEGRIVWNLPWHYQPYWGMSEWFGEVDYRSYPSEDVIVRYKFEHQADGTGNYFCSRDQDHRVAWFYSDPSGNSYERGSNACFPPRND